MMEKGKELEFLGGTHGSLYNPFPPFGYNNSLPVSVTTNNFRKTT
jgi:hypothetical protein